MEIFLELIYNAFKELRFRTYYRPAFHRFLNHKYKYYNRLPAHKKGRFLRLVRDHYEYFDFQPREKLKLTRAMKAIIASAAAQFAMTLPEECFTFFKRIIVYPDYYSSTYTHKVHKGEVNPGLRLIVFSWRGIQEGLAPKNASLNLLIHEFAHALWLESKLMQHEYTVLDPIKVKEFEMHAYHEMEKVGSDNDHFFRDYAFQNLEEFFAVSVETFFEHPEEFSIRLPALYTTLTALLRQNPHGINDPR